MRVYLFISPNGDGWSIAQRVKEEGHKVSVYINNPLYRKVGDGIIDKHKEQEVLVDSRNSFIDLDVLKRIVYPAPDCIVINSSEDGFGTVADLLRSEGYPVIGSSKWSDNVEYDKVYNSKIMKACGIVPWKDSIDGIPISVEAWFNGEEVVDVFNVMQEEHLMERERGPNVGGMGSVVWLGNKDSLLYRESIAKITLALKKIKYCGPVSIDCIINGKNLYGVKLVPRFRLNILFILLEMYKGYISDLLYGFASGVQKVMNFKTEYGMGINICVPPFPYEMDYNMNGSAFIGGIDKGNGKHVWFQNVLKDGNDLLCSGYNGMIGTVTARGDRVGTWSPVRDAKRRVLRTISNIRIKDLMYREDIGDTVSNKFELLHREGWF